MDDEVLRIVPMTAAHVGRIAELERLCFSEPWSEESLLSGGAENENAHFLVALVGDKIAGYIGVQEICGEAYITNVAVFPEMRRRGIGDALIKKAAESAEKRGCEFITLEVRQSNTAAIELYSKNGFVNKGIRKNFYSSPVEDAVIMTAEFN